MRKVFLGVGGAVALVAFGLAVFFSQNPNKGHSPCDGRQWSSPEEEMNCRYPYPPIGRWRAVYTAAFAKEHNLPSENISTDLSPDVDYMEMDVMPYGNNSTACMVNMLVKKPHDIALYSAGRKLVPLPEDRKLTHFLNLDSQKEKLKPLITFDSASRDYEWEVSGYRGSTFGMYIENILPSHDYMSANKNCRHISMHPEYFPGGYAFQVAKASVWGLYQPRFKHMDDPGHPRSQEEIKNSQFFINIPHEIISSIYEDVPIGRQ